MNIDQQTKMVQLESKLHCYQQIKVEEELSDKNGQQQPQPSFSFGTAFMIGFLYFSQGIIIALPGTMPFVYPKLPDYSILSLFSLSIIPFSTKFLTAPLVEKYSLISYGRRKTCIVISQIFIIIAIGCASFYTDQQQAVTLAFIFLIMILFLTLQDISLDALNVKQLKSTLAALMQGVFQGTGVIVGSMSLLKLTSLQFSQNILGIDHPITNPALIFRVLTIVFIISIITIHFLFKQTTLNQQIGMVDKSLCQTISYYKIFCNTKSKHFRIIMIFLFYSQGFVFFQAGYQYQLIKSGFSRDTLNTIGNIISIPINFLMCFFGPIFRKIGIGRSLIISIILLELNYICLYYIFPTDIPRVVITSALSSFLGSCNFIITSIIINDFPMVGVSGMFITMMASMSNFGKNSALHTKLTGIFTWNKVALFGLILQFFLIIGFPFYYRWYVNGDVGVNGQIVDVETKNLQENQIGQKQPKNQQENNKHKD